MPKAMRAEKTGEEGGTEERAADPIRAPTNIRRGRREVMIMRVGRGRREEDERAAESDMPRKVISMVRAMVMRMPAWREVALMRPMRRPSWRMSMATASRKAHGKCFVCVVGEEVVV